MKKIKIIFYLLLIICVGIIVYQNWDNYFEVKSVLNINLKFWTYSLPAVSNAVFFLGCFIIGYFFAWIAGLFGKFKAANSIKELNNTINAQQDKISTLRSELSYHKKAAEAAQSTRRQSVQEVKKTGEVSEQPVEA
jgi:uncharacterized integral membrane protein